MTTGPRHLGGIIHTYQKFDPQKFPSPTQPPPDLVSGAFEHMLAFGDMRELTDEELARAVRLDPSQIAGLGPSIDILKAMLEERKRKILSTYETQTVRKRADQAYRQEARDAEPPKNLRKAYEKAVREEQIRDFERLWMALRDDLSPFARDLMQVIDR